MKAKILVYALPALILATIHFAEAQQAGKGPRIGYLTGVSPSTNSARHEAFRQGLRDRNSISSRPTEYDSRRFLQKDGRPRCCAHGESLGFQRPGLWIARW
jgi:hypothetical protein